MGSSGGCKLLSRWSLFLFTTHAQLFLSISLSLIPFIHITFLFLLLYYHHVPSFYFLLLRFTPSDRETRLLPFIGTKTNYSYCRQEGPATFSETFLSGPPRSGLSALSTASSSSTKTLETFSSQRSSKNTSGAPAVIRRSVNASKLRLLELAVTGYPLSLPSKTLPLLPSSPARSFCDLRVLATSQRILPPFAETPLTPPFYSATSFALPNLQASWSPHTRLVPSPPTLLHLRSYPLPYFARTLSPTPVHL